MSEAAEAKEQNELENGNSDYGIGGGAERAERRRGTTEGDFRRQAAGN